MIDNEIVQDFSASTQLAYTLRSSLLQLLYVTLSTNVEKIKKLKYCCNLDTVERSTRNFFGHAFLFLWGTKLCYNKRVKDVESQFVEKMRKTLTVLKMKSYFSP